MPLIDVPNVPQFAPVGVQIFGVIDPGAINANFAAIASALLGTSTISTVAVDTQLTASLRNVLVDTSAVAANQRIAITLPINPAVGDTPCIVMMLSTSVTTPANCIITTADGTTINGIAQLTTPYRTAPTLWVAGDYLQFTYIGGNVGWKAVGFLNSVPITTVNPASNGFGSVPWQGQTIFAVRFNYSVEALQTFGAMARFCKMSNTFSITIGDATSTFNGIAGPYVIAAGSANIMYRFTNIGTRAFEVTT